MGRSCSHHPQGSTRSFSTLEVHPNMHTPALSYSRRSASGATCSFHVYAAPGGTGCD